MPKRIVPTSGMKSKFIIHTIVFLIANAAIWLYWYYGQGAKDGWVYPWGIWITAAWGLSLLGHWAAVYRAYNDPGVDEYIRQTKS